MFRLTAANMSDAFIGSIVLIDCGPVLGTYQGLVSDVDKTGQTISVTHVMHNGLPCSVPQVTIRYVTSCRPRRMTDRYRKCSQNQQQVLSNNFV